MNVVKKYLKLSLLSILLLFLTFITRGTSYDTSNDNSSSSANNEKIESICSSYFSLLKSKSTKPDYEVFRKAITGFFNLKAANRINNILTIIDFSISSKHERMWIIDMKEMKVLHSNLVAHGRNSGDEFATSFSNVPSSYQSSLGFYLTGNTYVGNHGLSLYLDGVEPGINDNARNREVVMHGADYVSVDFVNSVGRLGRSFGCPSIPMKGHEDIIKLLANKSCLYIYYPDDNYLKSSGLYTAQAALNGLSNFLQELPPLKNSN